MPNYRRALVPGGCWFFTVNQWERRNALRLLRPTRCLVDHLKLPLRSGYRNASSGDGGLKKCTLALSEGSALLQRIFTTGD
jgi:hypothetical protein